MPTPATAFKACNGFDGIRLFAAIAVILGHSFPLTGTPGIGVLGSSIQTVAVKIFFVISGYLISRSWCGSRSLPVYWRKRALRLFPALVVVCFFSIVILGPAFTDLTVLSYFASHGTRFYAWNLAFYPVYALPGVFIDNTYGSAVNGSLWSLPVEVSMYACVPVLIRKHTGITYILLIAAVFGALITSLHVRADPPVHPIVVWGSSLSEAVEVSYYFLAGSLASVARLERFGNVFVSLSMFFAATFLHLGSVGSEFALAVTLPYVVVSLGTKNWSSLSVLHNRDYSYGLYLYGFPIQQAWISILGPHGSVWNFALSLPVAFALAFFSWRLIERRALAMKHSTVIVGLTRRDVKFEKRLLGNAEEIK